MQGLVFEVGAVSWLFVVVVIWLAVGVLLVLLHGVGVVFNCVGLPLAWRREGEEALLRLLVLACHLVRCAPLLGLAGRASSGGGLCDGL